MQELTGGIHLNNAEHGVMIAERARCGLHFVPHVDGVISRTCRGKLAGGVIVQNYTGEGGSCCLHVASWEGDWLTRNFLWVTAKHCFDYLKCRKVLGYVFSTQEQVLAFDRKLGFREEARILDAVPGGDLVILSMCREECRWLKYPPRNLIAKGPPIPMTWQEIYS
jgi:RimJ/RimL family protein N-acetyltransferase